MVFGSNCEEKEDIMHTQNHNFFWFLNANKEIIYGTCMECSAYEPSLFIEDLLLSFPAMSFTIIIHF